MSRLWISLASLLALPLCAETIGNVEFQFPPAHYEWRLLTDDEILKSALAAIEEEDEDEECDEEECDLNLSFKVFTHREGDALETLTTLSGSSEDEMDLFLDQPMLELLQKRLDDVYAPLRLPNHKFLVVSAEKLEDGDLIGWEFTDGNQDLLHGYSRKIQTKEGITVLCYTTTASHSEENRQVWTEALKQATINE